MSDADSALQYRSTARATRELVSGNAAGERLRALIERIAGKIVFTNSFGIEGQLLAHHIFTEKLPIEVVTVDTGRLFPETYRLWQETEERYGVRIRPIYPEAQAVAEMVADSGINGFRYSKDSRLSCCNVRKVEPMKRALAGAAAWVTGLRADQSATRSTVKLMAWDSRHGLVKFAPLFDRTRESIVAECERLGVPINELHAQRYLSIGCEPCTRATGPGDPERAGRWWWEADDSKECGIHLGDNGRLSRSKAA